ncbi:hypothetical protein GUJ93_ZPchr0006g43248 [Zizania palustris]|uniref:SAC domain-containing protein n=1 Tax=Zizania palustris TaxID=103762 RepID=A0A8J5SYA9_ZIZPA|nr:hypothetical protein GUJ93_ZPchr0006g43248 [Zizania palustris]
MSAPIDRGPVGPTGHPTWLGWAPHKATHGKRSLKVVLLTRRRSRSPPRPPAVPRFHPPRGRHRRRRHPPDTRGHPSMARANDSTPSSKLHTRLRLWEFPDRYVFEPIDGLADLYLSDCSSLQLDHIFCNSHSTSGDQSKMEKEFSELLHAAEKTIGLYFSYDISLTLTLQRLHDLGDDFKSLPLWRQAEPRFLWNSYLLEPLIENKLDHYLLPVIQGSFQNIHAEVGSEKVNVTLIARRCTRRIGTRMWRRGADAEGYAANFVESEQIMESKGFTASYVQVRGSMPFLWEQIVDLTYKPSFEIVRQEEAPRILERHFHDLQKKYGAVLAVDLVNTHGGEGRLHDRYAKSIEPILSEDVRYVHFDFHRICGHIHFERLSQLYDQIEDYLKKHRYFLLNEKGEKIEEQTGTVRTNCVDCLDRTNVTQSMVGGKILESQLQRIGVLGANDTISKHPAFDAKYKVLWANHGDSISTQYSGTPALKGDFVRYGKRTTQGILNDLWNSLARYYLNNFADGTKQDTMDLLQGHYITSVSRDMAGPSKAGLLENYASVRLAFALVLGALMFMMMSLRQARNDVRHLVLSLLWAVTPLMEAKQPFYMESELVHRYTSNTTAVATSPAASTPCSCRATAASQLLVPLVTSPLLLLCRLVFLELDTRPVFYCHSPVQLQLEL